MKKEERSRLLKVGIFLASTIVIVLVIVAILGRTRSLFSDKIHLHMYFDNVNGLIVGSPVRLSGFDIGIVETIRFSADYSKEGASCLGAESTIQMQKGENIIRPKVYVEVNIQKEFLPYIRKDSIAQLSSKGLLGDTLIDIIVGDMNKEPVQNGACLPSEVPKGLTELAAVAEKTIEHVDSLVVGVDKHIDEIFTENLSKDLHRSVKALTQMIEGVEKGNGLIHRLIYDEKMATDVGRIVSNGEQATRSLRSALGRLNRILKQVQTGPGAVHSLFYQDRGNNLVTDLGHSLKEVDTLLKEVRTGSGLLHNLVYESDKSNLLQNLGETSAILKKMMQEMDQGKGTLGGLIKDPSVYKSLRRIIKNTQGTIEDSKILTWILRSLNKDKKPSCSQEE